MGGMMNRTQWQSLHGLSDSEMEKISLIRKIFNAQSINIIPKSQALINSSLTIKGDGRKVGGLDICPCFL